MNKHLIAKRFPLLALVVAITPLLLSAAASGQAKQANRPKDGSPVAVPEADLPTARPGRDPNQPVDE